MVKEPMKKPKGPLLLLTHSSFLLLQPIPYHYWMSEIIILNNKVSKQKCRIKLWALEKAECQLATIKQRNVPLWIDIVPFMPSILLIYPKSQN